MNTEIIVAIIGSVVGPAIVIFLKWLLSDRKLNRKNDMYAAKQSILQLIMEDKLAVMEGRPPENYQHILNEFDDYERAGGNHYVRQKVEKYITWYNNLTVK